jgi:hypothetical protein
MVREAIAQQDKRAANILFLSLNSNHGDGFQEKNMAFIMPYPGLEGSLNAIVTF